MVRYFVFCPACGTRVDLPEDEMEDPWKVAICDECGANFNYDPEDIQQDGVDLPQGEDPPSA